MKSTKSKHLFFRQDLRRLWPGTIKTRNVLRLQLFNLCFILISCTSQTDKKAGTTSTKFDQYYVHGEELYINNCSNCHQKNGTGLGLVYPPLKGSDYLLQNQKDVICLIRNGKRGDLTVNGKNYNQAMPAMPSLTDLEIAEISTYIYNTWGNAEGIVEVQDVSTILSKCDSLRSR